MSEEQLKRRITFLEARVSEKDANMVRQTESHLVQDRLWGRYCQQMEKRIAELEGRQLDRAEVATANQKLHARVKKLEGKLTWANSQWDRCVKRIKELEAELRNKKCEPHCGIITRCEELEELVRKLEVCQ